MKLVKKEILLSLACLSLSCSAFATMKHHYACPDYKNEAPCCPCPVETTLNHFEILGALGIASLNAGSSNLVVTSNETDRLVQTNRSSWNTWGGQLGLGYVYYLGCNKQRCMDDAQWFPSIEPELNIYTLNSNSIDGNVLRFGNPNFNDFTFDIPLHSTRVMLDAALTIVTKEEVSLFAIAGIGEAWNRVSYNDYPRSTVPCPLQRTSINATTSHDFAWELGAGVNYDFSTRAGVSFEYLYTQFGNVQLNNNGFTGTIATPIISSPSFNLSTQTALFGLHIAVF